MDERTEILICIASATAANCVPCFEHYYAKAKSAGIGNDEVQKAVDLANQVKKGGHVVINHNIKKILHPEKCTDDSKCDPGCK